MSTQDATKTIRPMAPAQAVLFFGLPFVLMLASVQGLIPLLDYFVGVPLFVPYAIAFGSTALLLIFLSLSYYRKEGWEWSWMDFCNRFRLHMSGRVWMWTAALMIFVYASQEILQFTWLWFSDRIPEPKFVFRLFAEDPLYFMEIPLQNNGLFDAAMVLIVLCAACAQEIWFRGYILPRQELVHGKHTWVFHALFFWIFLLFLPWRALQILPAAMAISFVAQRAQSTLPGLLAHIIIVPGFLQFLRSLL